MALPTQFSTSLEHLVTSSQGVVSKRIDLALLEVRQVLSSSIESAALTGVGVLLAVCAWLSAAAALVLGVFPQYGPVVRLTVFALINLAGALGCLRIAARSRRLLRPGARSATHTAAHADTHAVPHAAGPGSYAARLLTIERSH